MLPAVAGGLNQRTKTMSEIPQKTAVEKADRMAVEFVPFGAQDKVKLSVSIVQNLIAVKTKSGKTCSEKDAIKFLAMCQAKRLNPFESDCFLIGYDGNDGPTFSLVTAHQAYLKRAELHPEFDGMKSGIIVREDGLLKDLEGDFFDEGQQVVGGWATVYFKTRKQSMHKRVRLSRFQKSFGVWRDDAAGMICKVAEADALRSSFPTMLGGLYMREELEIGKPMGEAFAKPLFTKPSPTAQLPETAENGHSAEPAPAEATSEPATTDAPEPSKEVKGLRHLCAAGKIEEGELLGFLVDIGSTDGSLSSLEELPSELAKQTAAQWADIAAKIKAARKAGGK
jgi:phage recombination protein Bet